MRRLRYALISAVLAASALVTAQQIGQSPAAHTAAAVDPVINSPYIYLGNWVKPDIPKLVAATGVKSYTLAFFTDPGGNCSPVWANGGGTTPEQVISAIRASGGEITVSVGGYSGEGVRDKLGQNCASATALAAAYQKIVTSTRTVALDIDIEDKEVLDKAARDKVVAALKIVKQNNPGLRTVVTFGNHLDSLPTENVDMISVAAATSANIDLFTLMPFDNGNAGTDMFALTKTSVDRLKEAVKGSFKLTDEQAYRMIGLTSMNGITDKREKVSLANWKQIIAWAKEKHLSRVSFWSVNRDYQCAGGETGELSATCSGVAQQDWDFTRALASFNG
ncbi:chitinase [Pseudonocardiaceae bacterium YIM PH 21723]|nr:chitinase [Pseudonocardiaceae bacterium YIM PH 21723]